MNIVIDLSAASGASGAGNPLSALWFILTHGGWIILIPTFLWGGWWFWLNWRQNLFWSRLKFVLLAIDVPKENEQTPKAVEQIFAHLAGMQKKGNFFEMYIDGYFQPSLSVEIVSIEGYVQFLIHTPVKFRDLVEAAFYSQYPNAEISEIEDYTKPFKAKFPNEEFTLWGTEMRLTGKEFFPIRTYPNFEHSLSQTFLDPMANLLETFSRLGRGEQIWMQMVITPAEFDWREGGLKLIKKLIGAKVKSKQSSLLWLPSQVAQGIYESVTASVVAPTEFGQAGKSADDGPPSQMLHLPPNERAVVEQVGIKLSKTAYKTKMRIIYLAKHDVFTKDRVPGIMGSFRQFGALDMNSLILDKKTKTQTDYFFTKMRDNWRRRRILNGYKYRSSWRGRNQFILNVEELATLYHFPVTTVVKAPRVQKTESKRGEPPASLPVEREFARGKPFAPGQETAAEEEVPSPVPEELPTLEPISPVRLPTPGTRHDAPPNLPV